MKWKKVPKEFICSSTKKKKNTQWIHVVLLFTHREKKKRRQKTQAWKHAVDPNTHFVFSSETESLTSALANKEEKAPRVYMLHSKFNTELWLVFDFNLIINITFLSFPINYLLQIFF